jgi:hypothetical protein
MQTLNLRAESHAWRREVSIRAIVHQLLGGMNIVLCCETQAEADAMLADIRDRITPEQMKRITTDVGGSQW